MFTDDVDIWGYPKQACLSVEEYKHMDCNDKICAKVLQVRYANFGESRYP